MKIIFCNKHSIFKQLYAHRGVAKYRSKILKKASFSKKEEKDEIFFHKNLDRINMKLFHNFCLFLCEKKNQNQLYYINFSMDIQNLKNILH